MWQDAGSILNNSATGGAGAQVVATLTPGASQVAWIQGFTVSATNPTSTVSGVVVVSGVQGGPLSFEFVEASTVGGLLNIAFPDPKGIPGSGRGQAISVTLPAIGSGGSGAVCSYGYQL